MQHMFGSWKAGHRRKFQPPIFYRPPSHPLYRDVADNWYAKMLQMHLYATSHEIRIGCRDLVSLLWLQTGISGVFSRELCVVYALWNIARIRVFVI